MPTIAKLLMKTIAVFCASSAKLSSDDGSSPFSILIAMSYLTVPTSRSATSRFATPVASTRKLPSRRKTRCCRASGASPA